VSSLSGICSASL